MSDATPREFTTGIHIRERTRVRVDYADGTTLIGTVTHPPDSNPDVAWILVADDGQKWAMQAEVPGRTVTVLELAGTLTAHDRVIADLEANGWRRVATRPGAYHRYGREPGAVLDASVIVPIDPAYADYNELLAAARATLTGAGAAVVADRRDIPQQHRDLLADRIDEFIARSPGVSDQYVRGLRAASLIVRDGDKPLDPPLTMGFLEVGTPRSSGEGSPAQEAADGE